MCKKFTLFHAMLPCVSIAPLGRPVVPDVYMISATSSACTGTAAGSGGFVRDDFVERIPASAPGLAADIARTRQLVAHVVEHALVLIVGHDRVHAGVVHDELELRHP